MSKIRKVFEKSIKESKLLEGYYDSEYDEYYPDEDELVPRDEEAYMELTFPVAGHEALLDELRKAGYTKEKDWDAVEVDQAGNAVISLEDVLVNCNIEVDQYGDYEYIDSIYSVKVPTIVPNETLRPFPFMMDYKNLVDITDILSKEDLEYIKQKAEQEIELNEKPEEYDAPRVL